MNLTGAITKFLYDGYTSIDNLPDQLGKNRKLNNVKNTDTGTRTLRCMLILFVICIV